jgi:hypothetical protein
VGRGRLRAARAISFRVSRVSRRAFAVTALLVVAYVAFAWVHSSTVNTDVGRHDQGTYIWCARVLHQTHFEAPTNRSQMPGYLYLQALLYPSSTLTDAQLFVHAKIVSIGLSVLLVGALCVFFARTLPKTEARVAMLVTAFTLFVFRASYVQAELLFYTVSFFGFVALCRLWTRPSIGNAILAGLLEALAFLCKGSVQPGLVLFAFMFLVRAAWMARTRRLALRGLMARVAEIAVLVVSFLAPLAPYLAKSKEMYGSYFFNVNTRYVMWCDSWDDFLAQEARLGKWWTWGSLPVDQLPSMTTYLRTHSLVSIATREVLGVIEVVGNLVLGTGYFEFVALYLGFAAVAFGFTRGPWSAVRAMDARSPAMFAALYALLYLAVFGFYAPIVAGARFSLMVFLPVFYTLLRAGASRAPSVTMGSRTITWRELNVFVLVLAVLHVVFVLPITIGRLYAGG